MYDGCDGVVERTRTGVPAHLDIAVGYDRFRAGNGALGPKKLKVEHHARKKCPAALKNKKTSIK
jgi:hypothetical protein